MKFTVDAGVGKILALILVTIVATAPIAGLNTLASAQSEPADNETLGKILFYSIMTERLLQVIKTSNITINQTIMSQAEQIANLTSNDLTNLTKEEAQSLLETAESTYKSLLQAYMTSTQSINMTNLIHESLMELLIEKIRYLGESLNNTNLIQLANNLYQQLQSGNLTMKNIDDVEDLVEHILASEFSQELSKIVIIYVIYVGNSSNVSNSTIIAISALDDLENVVKALKKTAMQGEDSDELIKSIAKVEGTIELLNNTAVILNAIEEAGVKNGNATREALHEGLNASIRDLISNIRDKNQTLEKIAQSALQEIQPLLNQARSNLTEALNHAYTAITLLNQDNQTGALEHYMIAKGYYKTAEHIIDKIESQINHTMREHEENPELLEKANDLLSEIAELREKAETILGQANQTNTTTVVNLTVNALKLIEQAENLTKTALQLIQNNTNLTLATTLLDQAHDKKEEAEKLIDLAKDALKIVAEHEHEEESGHKGSTSHNETTHEENDTSELSHKIQEYRNKVYELQQKIGEYEAHANKSNNTEALELISQAKILANQTLTLLNQAEQILSNNTTQAHELINQAENNIHTLENLMEQIKELLNTENNYTHNENEG